MQIGRSTWCAASYEFELLSRPASVKRCDKSVRERPSQGHSIGGHHAKGLLFALRETSVLFTSRKRMRICLWPDSTRPLSPQAKTHLLRFKAARLRRLVAAHSPGSRMLSS